MLKIIRNILSTFAVLALFVVCSGFVSTKNAEAENRIGFTYGHVTETEDDIIRFKKTYEEEDLTIPVTNMTGKTLIALTVKDAEQEYMPMGKVLLNKHTARIEFETDHEYKINMVFDDGTVKTLNFFPAAEMQEVTLFVGEEVAYVEYVDQQMKESSTENDEIEAKREAERIAAEKAAREKAERERKAREAAAAAARAAAARAAAAQQQYYYYQQPVYSVPAAPAAPAAPASSDSGCLNDDDFGW